MQNLSGWHMPPFKVALWLVCIGVGIWFLVNIVHTLIIFGLAMLLTLALVPLVSRVTGYALPGGQRVSWSAAVGFVYLVLTLLLVTSLVAAAPVIVEQARSIAQDMPERIPRLQAVVDDWQGRFERWKLPPAAKANIEEWLHGAISKMGDTLVHGFELTATGIMNTFSWIVLILAAYLIAFFILMTYPDMRSRFYAHIPEPYRTDVRGLAAEMNHIFGGFVRGMGTLALCVGVCNYVLLSLVGVLGWIGVEGLQPFQYAMLVSVLSMIAYLVPLVGILVTSLIAGLLAWFQVPSLLYVCVIVITLLIGTNTIDRLLQPKILGGAMGVSPLFVLFAALAGAELFGFWGMIVGIPAAAMVKSIWMYVYRRFLISEELPDIHQYQDPLLGPDKPDVEPSLEVETIKLMIGRGAIAPKALQEATVGEAVADVESDPSAAHRG